MASLSYGRPPRSLCQSCGHDHWSNAAGVLKATTLSLQGVCWCRFVGGLSGLHTYFTSNNKSTYEHFRSRASSHENPYDVNCIRNWEQV